MTHLAALEPDLDTVPGTVSIWYGRPGPTPVYARQAGATHYAASTMKVAVLAALYRRHDAGQVDLDGTIVVHNQFASAARGGGVFGCRQSYDNDDAVWERLGTHAPLRWLAERMIIRSSNLATNLVLTRVGIDAVAEVWPAVGARHSVVARGIEDTAAADQGVANMVTAADVAALLTAITLGAGAPMEPGGGLACIATPESCRSMIDTLLRQERTEDLVAGLPPGTRVAHKSGWITGTRNSAGIVFPVDAQPFVLAMCLSTPWAANGHDDKACQLVARIAAAAWADRPTGHTRG